jgi:hypothetical protein
MQQDDRKLLELDGRRRLSLGALAHSNYYLAEVQDDGVIVLTPAEVVPAVREENRLRIRGIRGVWRWEVVGKDGRRQLDKGPGWSSREEAEAHPWSPRVMPCPDHGTQMGLNLSMIPVCAVPGCDFGAGQ